ncbi:hypothetical protein K8I61_19190 [bacterium]|nr:hypothetical protein [bacterium]
MVSAFVMVAWSLCPGSGSGDDDDDDLQTGEPCDDVADCEDSLMCINGTCRQLAEEGEDCASDAECVGDLICLNDTCRDVCDAVTAGDGSDGAFCREDGDCVSEYCDNRHRTQSSCQCLGCYPGLFWENDQLDGKRFNGQYMCYSYATSYCEGPFPEIFEIKQHGIAVTMTEIGGGITYTGPICDGVVSVTGWPDDESYVETGAVEFFAHNEYEKRTQYWNSGVPEGDPDGICFGTGGVQPNPAPDIPESENPCP